MYEVLIYGIFGQYCFPSCSHEIVVGESVVGGVGEIIKVILRSGPELLETHCSNISRGSLS